METRERKLDCLKKTKSIQGEYKFEIEKEERTRETEEDLTFYLTVNREILIHKVFIGYVDLQLIMKIDFNISEVQPREVDIRCVLF